MLALKLQRHRTADNCKISYFAPFKRFILPMKKYSRIFGYLALHKAKLGLYFICIVLSTLFGVISIGLLIPFMGLIFDAAALGGDMVRTNALGSYITN